MVPSLASEKIPSYITGDRSRDLPTSSPVLVDFSRVAHVVKIRCGKPTFFVDPSGRIVALGSTQRLTEVSSRDILGGGGVKAAGADNLATFVYRLSRYPESLNLPEPWGPFQASTERCRAAPLLSRFISNEA
jgi:hypothetical protein